MAKRLKLARKASKRKPRTVILIIGEGQTEEAYFRAIKQEFHSASLSLEIEPAKTKSDPVNLVRKADLRKKTGDYDYIFCVFDGDKPEEAHKARQQLAKGGNTIRGFVSVPCFELWLTLHFERSDAALPDCQQSEARLKRHWSDYAKGCDCDCLMPQLGTACENALWLEQQQHANPYTDLHRLMDVLEHALKETR
jgi:hypothetical protein